MSFASPTFLIGLALIPSSSSRSTCAPSAARTPSRPRRSCPRSAPTAPAGAATRPSTGYGVALAALLVALAKPQATVAVPTEQARVMIVTDRSGSMLADRRRAEPARRGEEGGRHVPRRDPGQGPRRRRRVQPEGRGAPVADARPRRGARGARSRSRPAGSTATGDAINAALERHQGQGARRDRAALRRQVGARQRPARGRAEGQAAQDPDLHGRARHRARARSTTASAVPPDPQTLAQIAQTTGGRAFTAGDIKALDQVYKRLGSQVATEKRQARGHEPLRRRRARR